MPDDFLTAADLLALDIDPDPARWPGVVTYTALDGLPCWAAADLFTADREDA